MTSQPEQSNSLPEWEDWATVRIVTHFHVKIKGRGPHPDMVDWEAAALELDRRIEEKGSLPSDIVPSYASVTSETEPWSLDRVGRRS